MPVYDYGTDTDGAQFIVMQLVEGDDLAALLRERTRLETDDAVRVAIGVASALEAAHRRGLVHRDVKPGNILITDDGEVKVTDFGIARAVAEASMTVTGTTLGSVHYFSPEQARGDEVTGASDVYSLGIVLYEMLTGRRPFEGDSAAGVALKRLNEDPAPPESFVPVPSGLSAIVMRALQREPADRFPMPARSPRRSAPGRRTRGRSRHGRRGRGRGRCRHRRGAAVGEPTVYVPPPVAMPSDRTPPAAGRRPCPQEDEGQPWWVWALLVLGILLLGLIGYLGVEVFGGLGPDATPSPTPEQITLPDYAGPADRRRARRASTAWGLCRTRSGRPSDESPATWSSAPIRRPGSQVSEGDTITVVISNGAETVAVPNLIGQTRNEADGDARGEPICSSARCRRSPPRRRRAP